MSAGGYEKTSVALRPVLQFVIGLGVLIIGSAVTCAVIIHLFRGPNQKTPGTAIVIQLPPEPRLQSHPVQDMAQFRQSEEAVLNHYGWVDRSRRIVRIPIERAMDLVAKKK